MNANAQLRNHVTLLTSLLLSAAAAAAGPEAHPTVIGQNDAPVLDNTKSPALAPQREDAPAPIGAVGTLISQLIDFTLPAGQVDNVTDLDAFEPDPFSGLTGIAVTAANTSNGAWFCSTNDGGVWFPIGSISSSNARLLAADADTRLYFRPTAGFSGSLASALTFRAWDQTGATAGMNGALFNPGITGGTSAFSTATDTAAVTVLATITPTLIGVASDSAAPSDTTLTINRPPGTTNGSVLAAAIAVRPQTATILPPSGWTLLSRTDNANSSPSSLASYYRVASAVEPVNYTFTVSVSSLGSVGAVMLLDGVDTTAPFDVHGGQNTPNGLAHTAPSVLAEVSGFILLTLHSFASSSAWTPPTGMTERFDVMSAAIGSAGVSMDGATIVLANPGATGNRTALAQSAGTEDVGNTQSIVFRPGLAVPNLAPELNELANPELGAIAEDAGAPTVGSGTLVADLVDFASPSGQVDNVVDADLDAELGIAVTAVDSANGTWRYSTDGGTVWADIGTLSHTNARLLLADANTRLHFQPSAHFSGSLTSAITFRAWDRSDARANGSSASVAANGSYAAFSAATDTASLVVASVNDAPTLDAIADRAPIFDVAGVQFVDLFGIGAGPGDGAQTLIVTATSDNPSLIPNPVVDYVSADAEGTIGYAPIVGQQGLALITVTVTDDAGVANGGDDAASRSFVQIVILDTIFRNGFE